MSLNKHLQRLERIHSIIKFKRSGKPEAFARRMGISRSLLLQTLRDLRAMGAPIYYDMERDCYAYLEPVELQIGFVPVNGQANGKTLCPHTSASIRSLPVVQGAA